MAVKINLNFKFNGLLYHVNIVFLSYVIRVFIMNLLRFNRKKKNYKVTSN